MKTKQKKIKNMFTIQFPNSTILFQKEFKNYDFINCIQNFLRKFECYIEHAPRLSQISF